MTRPVILGVMGDSAAGKTTIARGVAAALGEDSVNSLSTDGYRRYDRAQRAEMRVTPLDPDGNHLDVLADDLQHLRRGEPFLMPVYRHADGSFQAPRYVQARPFAVLAGLLGYSTAAMRDAYDLRVFLMPAEALRRRWKVDHDCAHRGYTTDEVLAELDHREADSAAFVRPQRRWADVSVSFLEGGAADPTALDVEIALSPAVAGLDLGPLEDSDGVAVTEDGAGGRLVHVPGDLGARRVDALIDGLWERLGDHGAATGKLGEYVIGHDRHRSSALALVQLLVAHQLACVRAAVAAEGAAAVDRAAPAAAVQGGSGAAEAAPAEPSEASPSAAAG